MAKDVLQPIPSGVISGSVTIDGQPIAVTISGPNPLPISGADGAVFVRSAAASTFPVNVGRVGGNPTSVGAGNADTGTQRVVVASDQPSITVDGTVAVTTDPDAPPLVALEDPAPSSALARWQTDVLELLFRQTIALERLALES